LKMKQTRIVLIGFRGAGKTSLARRLGKKLDWQLFSTDRMIADAVGMPIAKYVAQNGWEDFRGVERKVIASLPLDVHGVIDCGGGVIENKANMFLLRQNSLIVWVDADIETIFHRLSRSADRPLLSQPDLSRDIEENYRRRQPLYEKYSDMRVDASTNDADTLCQMVIEAKRD